MSGHAHPDELTEDELHRNGLCYASICRVCASEAAEKERAAEVTSLRAQLEAADAMRKGTIAAIPEIVAKETASLRAQVEELTKERDDLAFLRDEFMKLVPAGRLVFDGWHKEDRALAKQLAEALDEAEDALGQAAVDMASGPRPGDSWARAMDLGSAAAQKARAAVRAATDAARAAGLLDAEVKR